MLCTTTGHCATLRGGHAECLSTMSGADQVIRRSANYVRHGLQATSLMRHCGGQGNRRQPAQVGRLRAPERGWSDKGPGNAVRLISSRLISPVRELLPAIVQVEIQDAGWRQSAQDLL